MRRCDKWWNIARTRVEIDARGNQTERDITILEEAMDNREDYGGAKLTKKNTSLTLLRHHARADHAKSISSSLC